MTSLLLPSWFVGFPLDLLGRELETARQGVSAECDAAEGTMVHYGGVQVTNPFR